MSRPDSKSAAVAGPRAGIAASHPDPWRHADGQTNVDEMAKSLEARGRTPAQARLRRRFLKFVPVKPGERVLERARALCRRAAEGTRISLRVADGASLPFAAGRFDAALAVTVILHVADPLRVVREMARVTRPGGRVGLQDQDFGVVALTHPDRALTERIMRGVAERVYEEPHSGRRLPGLLRAAGLEDVRLLTDVYQDTTLEPWTKTFLERRAERALRFGIVDAPTAERWLDGFTEVVAADSFVLTVNYYGAVGVKPR